MNRFCFVAAAAVLVAAGTARAQVHTGDVLLQVQNARIITGRVESGVPTYPRYVVGATLGDTGIPGATFNPGYDSENSTFNPSQIVGLTVRKALRKWTGTDFSEIPEEQLEIVKGSASILTPAADPADCGVGDSLILGVANSAGKLHQHPAYRLGPPASAGIYAAEIQVWMSAPATGVSAPMWLLFNQDSSAAAFAEAFAWADARAGACQANCDGSTSAPVLNINDFICFQQKFAAGDCFANCDGSTSAPVLNVNDFICFQQRFAAGCP